MPEAFWEHAPLHTAAEVLARPSPVPARPGVYGWFFRVERGVYGLTAEGVTALTRWPQAIQPQL